LYGLTVAEIDWSVGRILDTLSEEGIDENTFVIFTTDNGPWCTSAHPLRGKKNDTWEGGMRVPAVVRWPGKIPAGSVNRELMTAMDLLPTFAGLAGAEVPGDRVIDGKDIWPVLSQGAKSPHRALFYHARDELQAVRSGDWKLHIRDGKPTGLFHLGDDIGETKNLMNRHPERVNKMMGLIHQFEEDIRENGRSAGFVTDAKPLAL
jgi:arylsulfatase A